MLMFQNKKYENKKYENMIEDIVYVLDYGLCIIFFLLNGILKFNFYYFLYKKKCVELNIIHFFLVMRKCRE